MAQTKASGAAKPAIGTQIDRPLVPVPQLRERMRSRSGVVRRKGKQVKVVKSRKVRRPAEEILKPPVLPWEEQVKRFEERTRILGPDPQERLRLALRKLNADPMLRLGYTANVPVVPEPEAPQPAVPPVFDSYSGMDSNRDGNISRQEYMGARARFVPAGPTGDARRRAYAARLNSRFRHVDRNNDGRITPEELEGLRNLRF